MKRACKWFEGWNLGFFVGKSKGKLECGVAQPQLVYFFYEEIFFGRGGQHFFTFIIQFEKNNLNLFQGGNGVLKVLKCHNSMSEK